MWENTSDRAYIQSLKSPQIQTKLQSFLNSDFPSNSEGIANTCLNTFQNIIQEAGKNSLAHMKQAFLISKELYERNKPSFYFKAFWKHMLDNSSKLSFYSTFKSEYKLEDYLTTIRNASQRKAVTKFRISCHKLQIEYGRYHNIPREQRLCNLCDTNEIEDEYHFAPLTLHYLVTTIKKTETPQTIYYKDNATKHSTTGEKKITS